MNGNCQLGSSYPIVNEANGTEDVYIDMSIAPVDSQSTWASWGTWSIQPAQCGVTHRCWDGPGIRTRDTQCGQPHYYGQVMPCAQLSENQTSGDCNGSFASLPTCDCEISQLAIKTGNALNMDETFRLYVYNGYNTSACQMATITKTNPINFASGSLDVLPASGTCTSWCGSFHHEVWVLIYAYPTSDLSPWSVNQVKVTFKDGYQVRCEDSLSSPVVVNTTFVYLNKCTLL